MLRICYAVKCRATSNHVGTDASSLQRSEAPRFPFVGNRFFRPSGAPIISVVDLGIAPRGFVLAPLRGWDRTLG